MVTCSWPLCSAMHRDGRTSKLSSVSVLRLHPTGFKDAQSALERQRGGRAVPATSMTGQVAILVA